MCVRACMRACVCIVLADGLHLDQFHSLPYKITHCNLNCLVNMTELFSCVNTFVFDYVCYWYAHFLFYLIIILCCW